MMCKQLSALRGWKKYVFTQKHQKLNWKSHKDVDQVKTSFVRVTF